MPENRQHILPVDDANNGAHFTDADSITYTDFCLGDTGAMTGHAVPQVAEAVSERVRRVVACSCQNEVTRLTTE